MASKQSEYLHEQSLQRLRALIPSGCPLLVHRDPSGFRAFTIDTRDELTGRFQVVHAFISGYVAAWQRVRPPVDAVSRGHVRYPGIVDTP